MNKNTCRACGEEVAPRTWAGDIDLALAEHRAAGECDESFLAARHLERY